MPHNPLAVALAEAAAWLAAASIEANRQGRTERWRSLVRLSLDLSHEAHAELVREAEEATLARFYALDAAS